MTDEQITRMIAEKVMGWKTEDNGATVYFEAPELGLVGMDNQLLDCFMPLTIDGDCMNAWDKFSEGRKTYLRHCDFHWIVGELTEEDIESMDGIDTNRRRAMCECMVKVMEDKK